MSRLEIETIVQGMPRYGIDIYTYEGREQLIERWRNYARDMDPQFIGKACAYPRGDVKQDTELMYAVQLRDWEKAFRLLTHPTAALYPQKFIQVVAKIWHLYTYQQANQPVAAE